MTEHYKWITGVHRDDAEVAAGYAEAELAGAHEKAMLVEAVERARKTAALNACNEVSNQEVLEIIDAGRERR